MIDFRAMVLVKDGTERDLWENAEKLVLMMGKSGIKPIDAATMFGMAVCIVANNVAYPDPAHEAKFRAEMLDAIAEGLFPKKGSPS